MKTLIAAILVIGVTACTGAVEPAPTNTFEVTPMATVAPTKTPQPAVTPEPTVSAEIQSFVAVLNSDTEGYEFEYSDGKLVVVKDGKSFELGQIDSEAKELSIVTSEGEEIGIFVGP